jgi:hypothetical protein
MVMPHIYLPAFLMVIIVYYKDKILVLTTYRIKYVETEHLFESVMKILYVIPLVYFFMGIWVFGNQIYFNSYNLIEDAIVKPHNGVTISKDSEGNIYKFVNNPYTSNYHLPFEGDFSMTYYTQVIKRFKNGAIFC